ncbi:uncharacterized protein B0H18DRAFT_614413 [Fomitopsis serialis]|uniref:uncharacterized protein n=1 Tax=Fomitopsis serialis TaxID=139415 RepID=UPI0020078C1D|nr:uncharacterized protein B0H18DRAFT_614413 [Neoantrodia serialis]KAH9920168.1 hypothetical protein B0H18DRAFT_614413 [Neoantrodia serialis]
MVAESSESRFPASNDRPVAGQRCACPLQMRNTGYRVWKQCTHIALIPPVRLWHHSLLDAASRRTAGSGDGSRSCMTQDKCASRTTFHSRSAAWQCVHIYHICPRQLQMEVQRRGPRSIEGRWRKHRLCTDYGDNGLPDDLGGLVSGAHASAIWGRPGAGRWLVATVAGGCRATDSCHAGYQDASSERRTHPQKGPSDSIACARHRHTARGAALDRTGMLSQEDSLKRAALCLCWSAARWPPFRLSSRCVQAPIPCP